MSVTRLMTQDTRFTIGHSAYRVTCLSVDEYSAPVSRHTSHQIKCTTLDKNENFVRFSNNRRQNKIDEQILFSLLKFSH